MNLYIVQVGDENYAEEIEIEAGSPQEALENALAEFPFAQTVRDCYNGFIELDDIIREA